MSAGPYEELALLAERELALAEAGRLEELAELQLRRAALAASLPERPPAHARAALERAARLQSATTAALATAARATAGELGRLGRGRAAARSYAPAGERAGALDAHG